MKTTERKPKYAMRKLSVGLVSCMLGFALIATPSHSLAAGGEDGEEVATEVEEELKDAPTELENDEGKINSNSEDLELAPEIEPETLKEGAESDIHKFNFRWKTYDDTSPQYDENHKGDKVNLKLELRYSDANRNRKYVLTDGIEFTLGEDKDIELDLSKYAKETGLENPRYLGAYLVATEDSNNYKFVLGSDTTQGSKEHTYLISQNMDTSIKEEKKEDAIILEKDKDNLDINYKIVEYEKDKETNNFSEEPKDKIVSRRGEKIPLTHERKFEDDKEFKLAWEEGIIGGSIERTSELDLFARNRKDRKFGILADFKDETHKKYYTLKIEGDDLEGWTVTLGSNLKDKIESSDEYIYYTTEYVEDETLDEGVRVLVKDGENGIIRETIRTIYLPGEDGKEEIIDKKVSSKKIKDMIGRIIRIGTKKKTPDTPDKPDPENPDKPIPDTPDKPEITDNQGDLTQEERDELEKLIQDLIDEMNKEEETPDTKPEDTKKPAENEEVKPSENEEENKKPEKEEKIEEGKKETVAPRKDKKTDQKASKDRSPKTGITGSASIIALLGSSVLASFGLRKKND